MAIPNTFYTIAHTMQLPINNRKKATPDNLRTVWSHGVNRLDRFDTLEEAKDFVAHEEYDTYKIYKTTVVEETE